MTRQSFLHTTLTGLAGLSLMPTASGGRDAMHRVSTDPTDPLKPEIVREFVGAGHGKFERVQEMLAEYPNLIYGRWDWGNGDFEEAVEAAGHVGNKEIANFLIEQGARVNLFVLTMLGKSELVKPILEAYPKLIFAKGAHGFTLLHHAQRGGEEAAELLEYVQSKGLTEAQIKLK